LIWFIELPNIRERKYIHGNWVEGKGRGVLQQEYKPPGILPVTSKFNINKENKWWIHVSC